MQRGHSKNIALASMAAPAELLHGFHQVLHRCALPHVLRHRLHALAFEVQKLQAR